MAARLHSWWQTIKQHPLIASGIIVVLLVLMVLVVVVVLSNGTGFNGYTVKSTVTETTLSPQTKVTITAQSQPGKTLWDWMQLLIVPLALAVVALVFQLANTRTERQIAKQRYEQDQQIALDKQHEDLLQAYLDRIAELLLKGSLRVSPSEEVRNVARVRTITVLTQLDARRIGYVFSFLREAGLMSTTSKDNVVSLEDADLQTVKWGRADLSKANLSRAKLNGADLNGANLKYATYITVEKLEKQAKSLKGATMPDGSIHP